MGSENLEKDCIAESRSNNKVPSHIELIERPREDIILRILQPLRCALEETVVRQHKQNRCVNILSQEYLRRGLLVTIYDVLGPSESCKPIEHKLGD